MERRISRIRRLRALLMAALLMTALGFWAPTALGAAGNGLAAASVASQSALPAASCTLSGTTRTCELWAKQNGSLSLPGGVTVPFWGYSATETGVATLPGPALIANQGETLIVLLHNTLSEPSSLSFRGQSLGPDTVGASTGNMKSYSFTLDHPGTSLYEAGLTSGGARQVAMGLFGALIVRPVGVPNQAYGTGSTFDDEALLVFSEIDPAFNANPSTFDLRKFAPKYWLINGKVAPGADPIPTAAGHKVLYRYLNAGLNDYTIGVLGLRQTVLAVDGWPLPGPYTIVSETVSAGQTMDLSGVVPTNAAPGTRYALYNAGQHLDNAGALPAIGGMLTFVTVAGGAPASGPTTSNVALGAAAGDGSRALTATITASAAGGSVKAAEYSIDTLGAPGSGIAFTFAPASPVNVSATVSATTLAALAPGSHTFYVRGQDDNGWGTPATTVLGIAAADTTGPKTTGTLSPNPTNGTVDVAVRGTADDTTTGGANIAAAEYFIDKQGAPAPGSGTPIVRPSGLDPADPTDIFGNTPVVALGFTLPAANLAGLAEGPHTISVRSQDTANNWGAFADIALTINKSGPTVSPGGTVAPNPNNGKLQINANTPAIQVNATVASATTPIAAVEGFIGAANADCSGISASRYGSGVVFTPSDGLLNSLTEAVYAQIDLSALQPLVSGAYPICVHGRDTAGNWGPLAPLTLIIDKTGPTIGNAAFAPNPTTGTTAVTLTATATDPANGTAPGSKVAGAEYFEGKDPGVGKATALTAVDGAFSSASEGVTAPPITVSTRAAGNYVFSLRARDELGNWGPVATVTLTIDKTAPTFTAQSQSITPNPTVGANTVTLTATATDTLNGTIPGQVAGAEWFEGNANATTPGGGTAMTAVDGAFGGATEQLTATIDVKNWTLGTHTLRIRARDAAGNWTPNNQTVSVTLTVSPLFADGFNSGNFNGWAQPTSGNGTVVSATNAAVARMPNATTSNPSGMQGTVNTANTGYVEHAYASPEAAIHARFYFNPNGPTNTNNNAVRTGTQQQDIFVGRTSGGQEIFKVQYQRAATGNVTAAPAQVRAGVYTSPTTVVWTNWVTITGATPIEIVWQSGTSLSLYTGGTTPSGTISAGVPTAQLSVIQLGILNKLTSAPVGNATVYFDEFVSTRNAPIGTYLAP